MQSLIVPIAGKSSRFSGMRPKWLLTNPKGNLMLIDSLLGLDLNFFDRIYITMLEEHEREYQVSDSIRKKLSEWFNIDKLVFTYLADETRSQPETIYETIKQNNIEGFIAIKDCDNYFELQPVLENSISVFDLHNIDSVNPGNKSYIISDINNNVVNIAEKKIISNLFCSGYYSFKSSDDFVHYYELLKDHDSLYISHIIMRMIIDNNKFIPIECQGYIDWGTKSDWISYKKEFKTIFCDIDGVVFLNGSEYFKPLWGTTEPIHKNISFLNELYDSGKVQIILTTARPSHFSDITEKQLNECGVKFHKVIYDLYSSKRIIINDFSNSNPYPSCDSINIIRNSENLRELFN